jgi:hypothetical protein
MICEEYRKKLQMLLDNMSGSQFSEELLNHQPSCNGCKRYSMTMVLIHNQLRQVPVEQPTEEFIVKLKSFAQENSKSSARINWKMEIQNNTILIVLITIMGVSNLLPVEMRLIVQAGILTTGITILGLRTLAPFFFTR